MTKREELYLAIDFRLTTAMSGLLPYTHDDDTLWEVYKDIMAICALVDNLNEGENDVHTNG